MLNINTGIAITGSRIDSDRDVLPFPTGGVHGPASRTVATEQATSAIEFARSVEAELDALKHGLDQLAEQIDEDESQDVLASIPLHKFFSGPSRGPHNPAA